jgi:tetratricopeptide (TPR) repeat protein
MTSEEATEECLALQDEVHSLILARRFDEACALVRMRRDEAAGKAENELAASLSTFLATCLTMTRRDEEALIAAQAAEDLDPASVEAKLSVARILLNFIGDPDRARAKAEQALSTLAAAHPHFRYGALALLGTARARCGDLEGAIAVFHDMTAPEILAGHLSAAYIGVFDLQVVAELVRAGVAKADCRSYLRLLMTVPNLQPRMQRQLDELLAATGHE